MKHAELILSYAEQVGNDNQSDRPTTRITLAFILVFPKSELSYFETKSSR